MAIMEFLAETLPKVKLLPEDPLTRAKVLLFLSNYHNSQYILHLPHF